jgi:hypothetical protein
MNTLPYQTQYWEITPQQAHRISQATDQEDTLEYKSPVTLIQNSKVWAIVYSVWEELVGCIFLMPFDYNWETIYERGSLRIHPDHRWDKLWAKLMCELTQIHTDKPLVSITTVESVKRTNRQLWLVAYKVCDIVWSQLKKTLEQWWELHDKYVIYMNQTMQNLFIQLK